jgi:hypothetical protein
VAPPPLLPSNGNGHVYLPPGASVPHTGAAQAPVTPMPTASSDCHGCTAMQGGPPSPLPGVFGLPGVTPTAVDGASGGDDHHGCDAQAAAAHPAEWLTYCVPGTNKQLNPDCVAPSPAGNAWTCGSIPDLDNLVTRAITQFDSGEDGSGAGLGRRGSQSEERSSGGMLSARVGAAPTTR